MKFLFYDYVVIKWGYRKILFYSDSLDDCYKFMHNYPEDDDLVVLFGKEDIPEEWPYD